MTAAHVTVIRVPAVGYQSGDVAAHVPGPTAAKIFHAAGIVAFFHRVHVPIALAATVANGNALALNVRRYAHVAVVE